MRRVALLGIVATLAVAGAVGAGAATSSSPPSDNLLQNPGAESGATGHGNLVGVPGWSLTGSFTVDDYGDVDRLSKHDSDRIGGGNNYFFGGPGNPLSTATETIDVSPYSDEIDKGALDFFFGGSTGAYGGQADVMNITAAMLNSSGASLRTLTISGPDASGSGNVMRTELIVDKLPAGVRSIRVTMTATRQEGTNNDGYADNLSLFLRERAPAPTGRIFAALPRDQAAKLLVALPAADAAAAMAVAPPSVSIKILGYSPIDGAKIAAMLAPKTAAKILGYSPIDGARVLAAMPFAAAVKIVGLQPTDGRKKTLAAMPPALGLRFKNALLHTP